MSAPFHPPRQAHHTGVHLVDGAAAQAGVAGPELQRGRGGSTSGNAANDARATTEEPPQPPQPPEAAQEAATTGNEAGAKAGSIQTKLPPAALLTLLTGDFCIAAASEDEGGRWWKYEGKRRGEFNPRKMKLKGVANLLSVWGSKELNTTISPYHISCSLKPAHLDTHLNEVLTYTKKDLKDGTDGMDAGTQSEQEPRAKLRPSERDLWMGTGKDDDSETDDGTGHDISITIGPGVHQTRMAASALTSPYLPLCVQLYRA